MILDDRPRRRRLSKERVLKAAIALADRDGLGALTMRRLGAELGVEAMSLYKHVANKDEILDGIVDRVIGEIAIPDEGTDWREAMRLRARSARAVLVRHSWAIGLLEARGTTGRSSLRYIDAILGNLRAAGFAIEQAAHAFHLLDSYVYGHVIQEVSTPMSSSSDSPGSPGSSRDDAALGEFPHLREMGEHATKHEYSFDGEFEFGLGLILDALEAARSPSREQRQTRPR